MKTTKNTEGKRKALRLMQMAVDRKATDVIGLDIEGSSSLCDYFVICSTEVARQAQALGDEIAKQASKEGIDVHHREYDEDHTWVLLDCFDVVMHIFTNQTRNFYNLEYLWREAKKISLVEKKPRKPAAKKTVSKVSVKKRTNKK